MYRYCLSQTLPWVLSASSGGGDSIRPTHSRDTCPSASLLEPAECVGSSNRGHGSPQHMPPPRVTGHGRRPGDRDGHSHGSCFGPTTLYGPVGAQRHQHVRPDDSCLLRNSDATTLPPQHRLCTSCPSTSEKQPRDGRHERTGERLLGDAAHRVRLLGHITYILRYITQFLNLRLLAAEAAQAILLPALDAASAPLTASSGVVSRASEARSQVDSRAGNQATHPAHTAQTQHRQPHMTQRQRGTRGSGASRRARQPPC